MDAKLMERILDKLDGLDDKLSTVDKTLVLQEANLREHMRRTDLLEEGVNKLNLDLKPLENHVTYVNNIFKFLGALGAITAFAVGIYKSLL